MTQGFDLDEIERLLAAATPGEWRNHASELNDYSYAISSHDRENCFTDIVADLIPLDKAEANAALIVAARNSLHAILTEIRELRAENARLREALVAEREDNLWNCFETGHVNGDQWTHCFMSDGEWLAKECGFDPKQGHYNADEIRSAIPIAARAALGEPQ